MLKKSRYSTQFSLTGLKIAEHKREDKQRDLTVNTEHHPQYEVVLYKNLAGRTWLNDKQYKLGPKQVLFVPPFTTHRFIVSPPAFHFISLQAEAELVLSFFPGQVPDYPYIIQADDEDFEVMWQLVGWLMKKYNYKSEYLKANMTQLLFAFIFDKRSKQKEKRGDSTRFNKLISYLDRKKIYSLDVNKAAEVCALSRSHFLKLFKESFSITFNRFLLKRRIERARRLLETTDKRILEIAKELDFNDTAHFIHRFRREAGMTPGEYRVSAIEAE